MRLPLPCWLVCAAVVTSAGCDSEPVAADSAQPAQPSAAPPANFDAASCGSITGLVTWVGPLPEVPPVLHAVPRTDGTGYDAKHVPLGNAPKIDRFTRGGVRSSWTGGGGRLKLLGGATLLTFGPPELAFERGLVSCRHAIQGGLLTLRAGGSVTLAQRPEGAMHELSVTVEGYLPRLAARAGAPHWTGLLYAKGQSPFHAAVSRRYFELLLRSCGS